MANPVVLLAIGIVAGAGLGALVTATVVDRDAMAKMDMAEGDHAEMVHDHSAHDHGQGGHEHKMIESAQPVPTLSITLHPDGPQGRNLEITTSNFTFDPTGVNGENVPGHGHAHIYLNGVKLPRSYAPWVHLSALPKGTHELRVTLNANDHSQLATNGTPITATTTFTIE